MGYVDEALKASNRALELTHMTQNERFRAYVMNQKARGIMVLGKKTQALALLDEAIKISRKVGMPFVGPRLLGTLSICTEDEEVRSNAIREGFSILKTGCHAHNQLWFLRDAIESSLQVNKDAEALNYARHLESITMVEPLAWAKYFIERARAIVNANTTPNSPDIKQEFLRLNKVADSAGFAVTRTH